MDIPVPFIPSSDCSLLVRIGDEISLDVHKRVSALTHSLLTHRLKPIRNLHPGYNSVLVSFDPLVASHSELEEIIRNLLQQDINVVRKSRTVEIPTCYGGEYGPDLDDVSKHCNLSHDEVIRIHSAVEYTVYFLGFSPGFPYLGDLPKQLVTPRLSIPRVKVPAGSVAIGGSQTGIYPVDSPGGWRIIGRTPTRLFQSDNESPTLLQMGDVVRFKPITRKQFEEIVEKEQMGG